MPRFSHSFATGISLLKYAMRATLGPSAIGCFPKKRKIVILIKIGLAKRRENSYPLKCEMFRSVWTGIDG
jgi:hypothetical protein